MLPQGATIADTPIIVTNAAGTIEPFEMRVGESFLSPEEPCLDCGVRHGFVLVEVWYDSGVLEAVFHGPLLVVGTLVNLGEEKSYALTMMEMFTTDERHHLVSCMVSSSTFPS